MGVISDAGSIASLVALAFGAAAVVAALSAARLARMAARAAEAAVVAIGAEAALGRLERAARLAGKVRHLHNREQWDVALYWYPELRHALRAVAAMDSRPPARHDASDAVAGRMAAMERWMDQALAAGVPSGEQPAFDDALALIERDLEARLDAMRGAHH